MDGVTLRERLRASGVEDADVVLRIPQGLAIRDGMRGALVPLRVEG